MAIDRTQTNRIEQEHKIDYTPKVEKRTEQFGQRTPGADSKVSEVAFGASLRKEALSKLFEGVADTQVIREEINPPMDYFNVDKKADEIIVNNTEDGVMFSSMDTDGVGNDLAEIAKTDPQQAGVLTDNILDKIGGSDKDEVAQSLVEALSGEELRNVASDPNGREMLDQLKEHLLSGAVWGDERATAKRIDTAVRSADLANNPEFQKLSPEVQNEVFSRLENSGISDNAVDNLVNLASSPEFAALPADTQKAVLNAVDNRPEDTVFVEGLKTTAGKADFLALNETQQAEVIGDLDRFAQTESYTGDDGFLGVFGGNSVSDESRAFFIDRLGNTAIYSQANPGIASVRNTLDKITGGEIKLDTFSEPPNKTGGITLGYNNGNGTLNINTHPYTNNFGSSAFTDTIVHELNHQLNPGAPHGTPDQFLNEYRAFYTGNEAVGDTLDGQQQTDIVDNLLSQYPDIDNLYNSNADFKQFIDDAKQGFSETPPVLLDPEQMRQALLDAGFSSDYLNTPGNIDNH